MRQIIRISILLSLILLSIHTTESYVRVQTSPGVFNFWNLVAPSTPIVLNGRVTYSLDTAGSDNIPFSQVEQAITASFQSWENIPTSVIAFQRGPNITSDKNDLPGVFDIFWVEDSAIVNDVDISGALAVSFITSNDVPGGGEILDASIVFNGTIVNGNEIQWATDGRTDAFDVQQVATHEIGHCLGLEHSPNGASTMFPRTGPGMINARTLSTDDQIAASAIYPTLDFYPSHGSISGHVIDTTGAPIFGAHVVVVDANGVVITGALTQPDGSYSIPGLSAGSYNLYLQPVGSDGNFYFDRSDLSDFYSNITTDFLTSQEYTVIVNPGPTVQFDFPPVVRGTPPFEGYLVLDPSGNFLSSVGASVAQGQNEVFVGIAGPGLPQSVPLTISGTGITILQNLSGTVTLNDGRIVPVVGAVVNVSPTAPVGPRNLSVSNGSQRTVVTGGFEILANPQGPTITSVASQADYSTRFAPGSLAVAFGSNLASITTIANSNPLPTEISGTSVTIVDGTGLPRLASLMYVSPSQINFQIPAGTAVGPASVIVKNNTGSTDTKTIDIQSLAPAILTRDATGTGLPVGYVIRFRADGTTSREEIARYDQASGTYVPIPIDMGLASDRVLLVLFGTGFRNRSQLNAVGANIGGFGCQVVYAGPQGDPPFTTDQMNIFLSKDLATVGGGAVSVSILVDGMVANPVTITIAPTMKPIVSSIVSQASYSETISPESLATVFGANLAGTPASANSNPLPTRLAGASILVMDSAGVPHQAALMFASPTQINFQIPAGTAVGPVGITVTNHLGYEVFISTVLQPVAPAIFTRDATGSGLPVGYIIRFRADGTTSQEPIAQFNPESGAYDPIPINFGSDRILLVLFGTGFRRQTVAVKVGGVAGQVVYAGPQGDPPFLLDQLNVFLDPSLSGSGPVNVELSIGEITANPVTVSIQ